MSEELRDPSYFALTALADKPRHGYGIIQEVRVLSDGRMELKPGTLYALLDRMAREGLVVVEREEVVDGRLRRYYALTPGGSKVLAEESRRRIAVSRAALRRLKVAGGFA